MDDARMVSRADHSMNSRGFRQFVRQFAATHKSFFTVTMFRHVGQGYNVVFRVPTGSIVVRVAIIDANGRIESTWVASDIIAVILGSGGSYNKDTAKLVGSVLDDTAGSVTLSVRNCFISDAHFIPGNLRP